MSNEQIFGNIIMLFSRFEMMMQTMEGQIKSYNQELGEQHKRAMELQKENTTLQESLNQLKLENHKLQKDIEALRTFLKNQCQNNHLRNNPIINN